MAKTKRYGNWTCGDSIGAGGQAQVFPAKHDDGRTGILKRFSNATRNWRSDREIQAFQKLKSPAIPEYLDSGEQDGRPWIVTAYCGRKLDDVAPGVGLSPRLCWFRDVGMAVRDAHAMGVVHRDIKPNNVVVAPDGDRAYLIDFGLCAFLSDAVLTTNEPLGTAAFAAPECGPGHPERCAAPSDIYSCGKLLYWLASGGKWISREETDPLEGTLLPGQANLQARVLSIVRCCVRYAACDRLTADELLRRAEELVRYDQILAAERANGFVRLIDNLGNDGEFNRGSHRSAVSDGFGPEDLAPDVAMNGVPNGSVLQAEQFENGSGAPVRVYRMTVGARSLSVSSAAEIQIVRDNGGTPSADVLGTASLSSTAGPAELYSVDCDILLPAGVFWVVFRAARPKTNLAIHSACDDVSPKKATFAESFDGGTSWEVKSTKGGGRALRIDAAIGNGA